MKYCYLCYYRDVDNLYTDLIVYPTSGDAPDETIIQVKNTDGHKFDIKFIQITIEKLLMTETLVNSINSKSRIIVFERFNNYIETLQHLRILITSDKYDDPVLLDEFKKSLTLSNGFLYYPENFVEVHFDCKNKCGYDHIIHIKFQEFKYETIDNMKKRILSILFKHIGIQIFINMWENGVLHTHDNELAADFIRSRYPYYSDFFSFPRFDCDDDF